MKTTVTTRAGTFTVQLKIIKSPRGVDPHDVAHALQMATNRLGRSERRALVFKERRVETTTRLAKVKPYGKRKGGRS